MASHSSLNSRVIRCWFELHRKSRMPDQKQGLCGEELIVRVIQPRGERRVTGNLREPHTCHLRIEKNIKCKESTYIFNFLKKQFFLKNM